jgi:hypothetical protein
MIIHRDRQIFWCFVFTHCLLWVMMPVLMRYALPHDTIEGVVWGHHLEWGYDKNPWMNAWLTRLGEVIGKNTGVGIYAMSSLFVGLSFWSVWELAKKIVSPLNALIAVLLLEGCVNYTLVPQGFNDNVIELGLWPLMFLFFYQSLTTQRVFYWILTGCVAGLGLMTKYYSAVPIAVMFLFLCVNHQARKSFQHKGIYCAIVSGLIVIFPHIIWLFQHDFLTIKYALNRADHSEFNIFKFAFSQFNDFIFPIIILFVLLKFKLNIKGTKDFNVQFIDWMALGPFILTLILSFIFKWHLYNEWGVPLVALWGIFLVVHFEPNVEQNLFKKFLIFIYTLMFLWAIGYAAGLTLDKKHKHSDNYPAQEIANYVTMSFRERYHQPLKYVAGSRYVGGYISFYSIDHPDIFVEWNPAYSSWINLQQLKKSGAVFVQDNYYGTTVFGEHPDTDNGKKFPEAVLKFYPNLIILPVKYFSWKRGNQQLEKIPVLIGFLPPEK